MLAVSDVSAAVQQCKPNRMDLNTVVGQLNIANTRAYTRVSEALEHG